jgi:hypothetical protein
MASLFNEPNRDGGIWLAAVDDACAIAATVTPAKDATKKALASRVQLGSDPVRHIIPSRQAFTTAPGVRCVS